MLKAAIRLNRYLRGRKALRRIQRADCVVVSFGKSGRTWLRVLLSRYYQLRYHLPEGTLIVYDTLRRLDPELPVIYFAHDYYLRDYTGAGTAKAPYHGRKLILLVRDPCDTAVSSYFQRKHRMRPIKRLINGYPSAGPGPSVFDFVMGASGGLPKIIGYLNEWHGFLIGHGKHLIVRYEDLRRDTRGELRRVLRFLDEHPTEPELDDCVSYASLENMRRMEEGGGAALGRRLRKLGSGDESGKVRRAKVGGYADYLTPEQVRVAKEMVRSKLASVFGYPGGTVI